MVIADFDVIWTGRQRFTNDMGLVAFAEMVNMSVVISVFYEWKVVYLIDFSIQMIFIQKNIALSLNLTYFSTISIAKHNLRVEVGTGLISMPAE